MNNGYSLYLAVWDLGDPDLLKLCVQTTLTAGWGLVDTLLIMEAGALQGE